MRARSLGNVTGNEEDTYCTMGVQVRMVLVVMANALAVRRSHPLISRNFSLTELMTNSTGFSALHIKRLVTHVSRGAIAVGYRQPQDR